MTAVLQVATILVAMASEKYIWALNSIQKSLISNQQIFCNSRICVILKLAVTKLKWFCWDQLYLHYLKHLSLTFNFAVISVVTKYQGFQDVIYNMEGLDINISAQFK